MLSRKHTYKRRCVRHYVSHWLEMFIVISKPGSISRGLFLPPMCVYDCNLHCLGIGKSQFCHMKQPNLPLFGRCLIPQMWRKILVCCCWLFACFCKSLAQQMLQPLPRNLVVCFVCIPMFLSADVNQVTGTKQTPLNAQLAQFQICFSTYQCICNQKG